jgi:DNA processing protein
MSGPLSDAVRDLLALQLAPGLGPRRTAALLAHFGSAAAVRRAGAARLAEVAGIGHKLAQDFARALAAADVAAEEALLARHNTRLLVLGTPDYPSLVAAIPDPPHLLYVRGSLTEADANAVALVGSRDCTDYGRRAAARLAAGLARAGVTVVSGLARGIDGIAHRAALEAGGRTLAVLAGGLSRVYPPEHADLARQVEANGALLSESTMSQEPLAPLFPARNRIISGLCRVVVVVEAAERSGALLTAEHAGEQGRTVMAVPGPVDGPASGGANALVRQGAVLCRGVDDILEELHGVSAVSQAARERAGGETARPAPPPLPVGPPPGLTEEQRRLWDFLGAGPRTLDELAQHFGVPVAKLTTTLTLLEMKRVVRRLPGNRYERA